MPAQPSLAAPRNLPGWKPPQSVPFGGKSGLRKPPKARPKLSKLQKKALKWASKHPEGERPAGDNRVWATNAGITNTVTLYQDMQGFIGQPATPATLIGVQRAVQVYVNNNVWTGTVTNGTAATINVYPADTQTITITANVTTANTTVNLPMWDAWNANWAPTAGWAQTNWAQEQRQNAYRQTEWIRWQGQGNQADLYYNPNDQVQRERIRRERAVQNEAQYQQQRMARAAREAEERRQWEARAPERAAALARQVAEQQAQQEARKTALKRSYDLLFRHLTDEQKNMLESENRFLIEVKSGKIYEIRRGMHQNIYRLDDQGRPVEQLCCLPQGQVPEGDVMLAQMLHLMVNEEGFRKVANRWELRDMTGQQLDRRRPLTQGAAQVDRRAA